jgi:hypothetical protein
LYPIIEVEQEIKRGIAQGRKDIKEGRFREMTPQSNAAFVKKLSIRLEVY